ncbi:CBS domain-containing protein [Winogradskyella vincentii]|uniref:CBS domain-containing protein n=1 Tax=Winogradskyella vincentii TaxID=2877122 RepID=A0ABS7Y244_9FLAO|nr:CBS domain-containing protein [Winogradskyella vincentii]MCA0152892.1 CBS domain-containing protein [Winogradskyella vincentii]
MRIQIKDFMSSPVTTAMLDDNVLEIRTLMKEKGINAIPIVQYSNDKLKIETTIKGIITATDICKEVSDDALVKDMINASLVHIAHVNTSAKSAAKMMLKHNVHHIIAMEEGEIKGMVSSLDFVKLVAEHTLD